MERSITIQTGGAKVVSTIYLICAIAVMYVQYVTSASWYGGIWYAFWGGLFWPITTGIWAGRLYLLPFLRANGLV